MVLGGQVDRLHPSSASVLEIERLQRERKVRMRELSYLPGTPASLPSASLSVAASLARKAQRNMLLVLLIVALVAPLARAQTIFNCSSMSSTGACGVTFFYPLNETFG